MLPVSSPRGRRLRALVLVAALGVLATACTRWPTKHHRPTWTRPVSTTTTTSGHPTSTTTTTASTTTSTEPTPTTTTTTTTAPPSTTTTTEPSPTTTDPTMPTVDNVVAYELDDFTITQTQGQLVAGMNLITVDNVGSAPHEINFVRAPDAASLPTTATGAVDFESIPLIDQMGMLRVAAGQTSSGIFTFTPGTYVGVCNIGATGANPHFSQGMFIEVTVS